MPKGTVAKTIISKKILDTFEGAFPYNDGKEIRIPIEEDGEIIQIKVTLTAAKVAVEPGSDNAIPTADNVVTNNIISDLKKDEKASKIIKGYDIKLEKSENEEVISDNEEMTFSVYADNISYNILRYDISIKDSENNILVTYLDKETDVIEVYSDNEKQSTIKINDKNNIYDFDILDNKVTTGFIVKMTLTWPSSSSFWTKTVLVIDSKKLTHKN